MGSASGWPCSISCSGDRGRTVTNPYLLPDARTGMNSLVLRNVRPYGEAQLDVRVENGVIAELGSVRPTVTDDVLDGEGAVLLPGLVDLHTHLREPGREDAETVQTGSAAAALGGYAAVHAMANTDPVADTAGVVEQVWRLGRAAGHCDVQPVGAVTVGLNGARLAERGRA